MIPFVQVTEKELRALMGLPHRECMTWLAVKFLTRNGWTTNRRQLEGLTGIGKRQTQLVLAALEQKGFLSRKFIGHPKHPPSRFSAQAMIPGDRCAAIADDRSEQADSDRGRSLHTFLGSELRRSKTDHRPPAHAEDRVRCAAEPGGRAGDLCDDRMAPLERLCRELFSDMKRPAHSLRRLLELAPHAPLERLEQYLRHEASTSDAKYPLGAACTLARWEAWSRRRKRARVSDTAPAPTGERVSAAELEAFAKTRR